ncbi:hypothetical protein S40285_01995 [Stachybotrys chlorohalonatus IBT 40285]|uniref:Uncharacterized protein n=1 Tax=Stachybotrys chlorohalonatus (strain IBT 40285) TaxID=1283841 RepID=A0A084QIL1_STAC4|nr:hypothetical protein S40285_01995 [Stachybotrys chlorohalonata IBT 40285]
MPDPPRTISGPKLGEFGMLKLCTPAPFSTPTLRVMYKLSKGGIPSFATSAKPAIKEAIGIEDFLSVEDIEGLGPGRSPGEWWLDFRNKATEDKDCWLRVQGAMADFGCIVEVVCKPGPGWLNVPPRQFNPEPIRPSRTHRNAQEARSSLSKPRYEN